MSTEERVARLEVDTCNLKEEITEVKGIVTNIKDNHLHSIESKLDWYAGVGAAILFALQYFK